MSDLILVHRVHLEVFTVVFKFSSPCIYFLISEIPSFTLMSSWSRELEIIQSYLILDKKLIF